MSTKARHFAHCANLETISGSRQRPPNEPSFVLAAELLRYNGAQHLQLKIKLDAAQIYVFRLLRGGLTRVDI
jgi:hypothetical protein